MSHSYIARFFEQYTFESNLLLPHCPVQIHRVYENVMEREAENHDNIENGDEKIDHNSQEIRNFS